jgi:hypothetical protein
MAVLPCVLGRSFGYAQDKLTLRRTIQVSLGFDLGFRICPSDSHPSGGFPVSDLGFLTTISDIELSSSDFAVFSLVLTSFSANFQSAFRNRLPGGTPIFVVS